MPTRSERNALLFVAAVLLLGAAVRVSRSLSNISRPADADRASITRQIDAVQKAKTASNAEKALSRSNEPVNVNTASAAQLKSLPKVGAVLAERIISFRDSVGGIRSLEQLDQVKGIGPAMLKELAKRVTF